MYSVQNKLVVNTGSSANQKDTEKIVRIEPKFPF